MYVLLLELGPNTLISDLVILKALLRVINLSF
jgi:hypothetical protein